MKKNEHARILGNRIWQKAMLIMKLTTVFYFICLLQVSATVYSQSTMFTIGAENKQISHVLKEIEKTSNFRFFYQNEQVDVDRLVSIKVKDATVEQILNQLFEGSGINFKVMEDFLILLSYDNMDSSSKLVNLQEKSISGKVSDYSNSPLPGVTVILKGTTLGTVTDADGNYSLGSVSDDAILVFSFVGMLTQEIPIAGKTTIDVIMAEDAIGIEEVVAIGYGTMKKSDLTGSLASVSNEEISAFPATTVAQALQGRASGVQIIQNTGQPGAPSQIRIRGTNSIKGDNSPLWIIDGFPGDESILNMSDIESIEVLKDASATAIYGSRGANGVILVTTKQGKAGVTKVDYSGRYTFQSIRKKLDLMNAEEYMRLTNIQQLNDLGQEYFSQSDINNAGEGIDWQDEMFRVAPLNDHSLTVSGGNEKTQFSVGGSYFDQKGIMLNDDGYRRISLRANVNHDISKKFSITYNAILTRIDQDRKYETSGPWQPFAVTTYVPPTLKAYNDNGSYLDPRTAYPFSYDGLINTINYANEVSNKRYSDRVMANIAVTYKPIQGLSIKISGNVNNSNSRIDEYTPTTYIGSSGDAELTSSHVLHLNSDNIVTYKKTIGTDHNISAMGAITYEEDMYTSMGTSGSGFLSDNYETHNIGAASLFDTPSSSYAKWNLLSYLGRLNYSYKSKYMVTMSFRADGSSRYSEGNKWGYFPSGALAWRISDESFMEDVDFISNLKLRAGYGETGSTAISPYATLSMLSTGKTVFDKDDFTYFAPSSTFPGNLKWETTSQTDIGIDIGFLDNRLNLTADYYVKNTRDLLNSVQLPRSTGYQSTIKNIGKIQNKGLELQLDAKVIDKELKWDLTANISFNKNKVVELYEGQDITGSTFNVIILGDYVNLIREGERIAVFYGYQEDGYNENGIIKYKDLSGDGSISAADKTIIGDPNPDFIYSLNSVLSYENFELSWFIQGSQGNDIMGLSTTYQNYHGVGINTLKEVLNDHWTPQNTDAKYPKISTASTSLKMSDRFVYDGSYVRLKNVQLAYNIPVDQLGIGWMKRGQVYVSGQNLMTLTSYPWWDPEVNSRGGGSSLNQGIDFFTYPVLKGLTFGIKIGF